jgi:hypothetical protein
MYQKFAVAASATPESRAAARVERAGVDALEESG